MSPIIKKAIEALEAMPEDMRESAVAYLVRESEKFQALKAAIEEGIADVEAGRVVPWDPEDIWRRAKQQL
jgi:predicted transcriptional regulator